MPIPSFTHPSKTLRSQPDEKQEKTKIPAESNASISSSGQQDLKIVDQDFAEFLPKRQSSKKSKEKYINLDVLNDYEAANLYKVMFQADDNDVKGIASKQPCIKKPDLLEDAVAQLSKTYLAEALLECNILVAIKHLLEPLPETIRQLATQLVEKWSRSILGLSDDYREVAPTLSRKFTTTTSESILAGSSNQENFNQARNILVSTKEDLYQSLTKTMRRLKINNRRK
ncbi:6135_t:CDS:2 [Entrophospora sp. SA101]|nr:6135_t:CDS:2 [Entrophospora sp. SA101]